jgi:import inner membrane translocase subunit TIM50
LSYLNRPLNTVISLDTHPEHVSTHPENAIIIPPWKGNPDDKGLIAMIPFLECKRLSARADVYSFPSAIGIYKPQDVRPVLAAYQGKDIPLEYAKKEAEAKALHVEKWTKDRPQGLASSSFSSMLGLSSVGRLSFALLLYLRIAIRAPRVVKYL